MVRAVVDRVLKHVCILFSAIAFMLIYGSCVLHAQESAEILQSRITEEVHLIKTEIDQHQSNGRIGYLLACLAADYRKAGDFNASESAYMKALARFEHDDAMLRNYATVLDNLSSLYLGYDRLDEAERYNKKSLRIRQKLGRPIDLAWSVEHMAEINLARLRLKEAESGAAEALKRMQDAHDPDMMDRIQALNALAFSRCLRKRCAQGLEDARLSLDTARNNYGIGTMPFARALMAVGFASWKLGKLDDADRMMLASIQIMRSYAGSESRALLGALAEYREYLQSVHREAEVENVSRELAGNAAERYILRGLRQRKQPAWCCEVRGLYASTSTLP